MGRYAILAGLVSQVNSNHPHTHTHTLQVCMYVCVYVCTQIDTQINMAIRPPSRPAAGLDNEKEMDGWMDRSMGWDDCLLGSSEWSVE